MTLDSDATAVASLALGALALPLADVLLARKRSLLGAQLTRERRGSYLAFATGLTIAIALLFTLASDGTGLPLDPNQPLATFDGLSRFLGAVTLGTALLTVLSTNRYLAGAGTRHGEYYALLLASLLGLVLLPACTHMVSLYLALELASVPGYALAGIRRDSPRGSEAALKAFLAGSVSSAVLLYGAALLYGATGELALLEIGLALDPGEPLALLGGGLVLIGLAGKLAIVPFHQWSPDTFEGAPVGVVAFLATAWKIAVLGALVRVLTLALAPAEEAFQAVLWALAALSMTLGNLAALVQRNTKRMFAYAGLAHLGYVVLGLRVGGAEGTAAVLFFLLAYAPAALGTFAAISALARDGRESDRLEDLAGLFRRQPLLALALAVCVFSLIGVPGTAGFVAKFQLFSVSLSQGVAAGDTGLVLLTALALANVALSAVFYLRVPVALFMREDSGTGPGGTPGSLDRAVLAGCAWAVLILGIAPQDAGVIVPGGDLLRLAQGAAGALY
ncbi:MAG: NADH-quinone oxidoreductase subunit N [Proteobacteria bacterium]|nr:NADH-quinone oxidoreductase subunit N [Pseudomonadota bacterium]